MDLYSKNQMALTQVIDHDITLDQLRGTRHICGFSDWVDSLKLCGTITPVRILDTDEDIFVHT